MKLFIAIVSVLLVGLVAGQDDVCYKAAESACSPTINPNEPLADLGRCNAQYGGIAKSEAGLQAFANEQLVTSYDYLLLATFFNSYQKDRPGFVKLFQTLSDKAFDKTIKLIQHITKRGGVADFRFHQESPRAVSAPQKTLEVDELHAIAKALDYEKKLSKSAISAHVHASKHNDGRQYDPEITQFLEEEFLSEQSENIRKLSGYANDLFKIMNANANNTALGVYLFDQYLQKQ